ncbi:M20 metallopeptidase family protein [Tissierella creatinophila]
MIDVLREVKKIEKEIISWRRELHKIPELGLELPNTSKYIQRKLSEMKIEYHTLVKGNAIVGIIKGSKEGKTIALRADMDGLPIKEETGLSFASTNGLMHACGHDAHSAMLLGAAKVLNENKDKLKGNVKLFFQPGEEYPGGALPMIEEGAMEDPKVDAVLGLHNGSISKDVAKGKIGVCYGPMMASMDRILIKIKGKGSHGAYPEQSIDPISTAAEVISALQRIVSREVKAIDPAVLSITRINGGFNQNIIPDVVEIEGTVRAVNPETRNFIAKRIDEITRGVTTAMRADCEVEYEFKYPPLINSEDFTKNFVESAKKVVSTESIYEMKDPVMGGEDMAYFLEKAPGTFFFLSNPNKVDGIAYPHHSSKFDVDENLFYIGSSLFVQAVLDFLK